MEKEGARSHSNGAERSYIDQRSTHDTHPVFNPVSPTAHSLTQVSPGATQQGNPRQGASPRSLPPIARGVGLVGILEQLPLGFLGVMHQNYFSYSQNILLNPDLYFIGVLMFSYS